MIEQIFENYEAFRCMVTSVTLLSNTHSKKLCDDGKKIIEFIGNAYGFDGELISECQSLILDKLCEIALISDAKAFYNTESDADETTNSVLFEIKGNVLEEIYHLGYRPGKDMRPFDYSHYVAYEPHVRFCVIQAQSISGNILATRQVGIMKMLGIGCEQSVDDAISRLFQCTLWGDIPSMYLLATCYDAQDKDDKSHVFFQLAELCTRYLKTGVTVLPQAEKEWVCEEAITYYAYISTILQDVILAYKAENIDFSFVEAITSDSLDYFRRMNYINNYERKEWKNVTNSAVQPSKKIGF